MGKGEEEREERKEGRMEGMDRRRGGDREREASKCCSGDASVVVSERRGVGLKYLVSL